VISDAVETAKSRGAAGGAAAPEVTFVFPCLDEQATIATVVRKARARLDEIGVAYEILVVDNGSEDGSAELAEEAGARPSSTSSGAATAAPTSPASPPPADSSS